MSDNGFWPGRPTLITGGTGLLGCWLVRRLVVAGATVICLTRDRGPSAGPERGALATSAEQVHCDITDRARVEQLLGDLAVDTVLHLAAQTIVGIAEHDPVATFETNIRGTWQLLEACRRTPTVKQIVLASSDKAYGEHQSLPYRETAPLQGRHPYDVSKSCADLLGQCYAATYGLPLAITRCGNFYGGGDLNWTRIVPGTIRAALEGRRPVVRSDGLHARDFFYVEDGAEAHALLAEQLASRPELRGEAFNFSNEREVTVIDLVRRILALMGSSLEPDVHGIAHHEIRRQYLDADKARCLLAWRPRYTLDEGLERTIEWYRSYFSATSSIAAVSPPS